MPKPPPQISKHLSSSLARVIVESVIGATAASDGPLADALRNRQGELAKAINQGLRPHLEALIGQHLAAVNPDHPIARIWDEPPDGPAPGSQAAAEAALAGEKLGGPADFIVEAILTILGIVGAAFGILGGLGQIEAREFIQGFNAMHDNMVLTPDMLADMVERSIITLEDGTNESALSGINADRFDLMVLATGEPPGLEQMLGLWRRGLLDTPTLNKMVAYSRVRTEWTPYIQALAWDTMPQAEVLNAVLKGDLSEADGRALFAAAGGLLPGMGSPGGNADQASSGPAVPDVDQFAVMLAGAGDAIGVEAALNLYNHQLITDDQVRQVILHSRINPQFEDMAMLLRHKWLGIIQIQVALKAGTVSVADATTWLLQDGYPADQVQAFIAGETTAKVAAHKNLSEAMIVEAYEARRYSLPQATAGLEALGYDANEVTLILGLADDRRQIAQVNAAIKKVQTGYLASRLSESQAKSDLSTLGVSGDAITDYLSSWALEKSTQIHTLSAAQVGYQLKHGGMTQAQAIQRWLDMGYDAEDAGYLAYEYGGNPPNGSPAAIASKQV